MNGIVQRESSAGSEPTLATEAPRPLLKILREQPATLCALLDAARHPRIIELVRNCKEEHQPLFEGWSAMELENFAPYLLRLPPDSASLETLVREGWGNSWGVYLTSSAEFAEVRKHFRRFLRVKDEGGNELYFRFYDPRVLRVFLPTCTADEVKQFFGPIECYLMEAEQPHTVLRFTKGGKGVEKIAVSLSPPGQPGIGISSASPASQDQTRHAK